MREALNEHGSVGVVGNETQPAGAGASATAVHGLGGMGKTELALAYAHAFAWDYPGGRWLARCEGLTNFDLALRQLGEPRALNITFTEEERQDAYLAGERVLAELNRRGRSLLLLDNVTYSDLLGPDVLMRLPPQGRVHLLATTRLGPAQIAGSPHDHTFVAVDELPADDALALIRAHQPDARFAVAEDEAAARELVALLAGFTLVVETTAIYLGRHAAPSAIAVYTERLRLELLAESEAYAADPLVAVRHKERLLERTLAVTLETLPAEQLQVLILAALLPADQIALPWVRAVANEQSLMLNAEIEAEPETAWQQLVDSLLSLRLFQSGGEARVVRMHRLVQQVISTKNLEQSSLLQTSLFEHIKWRARFLADGWVKHDLRWELAPLAACAWQWMERVGADGSLLASGVGSGLYHLGYFSEAEPLLRRALAIDEQSFGPNHPNVATSLANLANVLHKANRLSEAEPLLRRALTIAEKSDVPHSGVATVLNNLGSLLQSTGQLGEAEMLLRRALTINEGIYGPNCPQVAMGLSNLATLLQNTNRLEEAEPLLRRALKIEEESYGPNHPNVAITVSNLALLLKATKRFPEAEPLFRRVVAIDEQSFGPDHYQVATGLNNLASLLHATKRFEEAEPLARRALAIDEGSFGPDHANVARDLNNLAQFLNAANRRLDAEPLLRRAVDIYIGSLGANHPDVATALNNLASGLLVTGRPEEAEQLMRRAVEILFRFRLEVGHEHPSQDLLIANYISVLRRTLRSSQEVLAQLNLVGHPFGLVFDR